MSPLLRASFHGLRCSRRAPSQRERLKLPPEFLNPPESRYSLQRWYGESVALEETCSSPQLVNDTTGECKGVSQGEDSPKVVDAQKFLKEMPQVTAVKQECATKEPVQSTDKLSSLIMGKMRSKNSPNGSKDKGIPLQTEITTSKADKLTEGSSQQIGEDKWNQVMNSMRNMAARKKQTLASGGAMANLAKSRQDENQDDFADLELPQAGDEAVSLKGSIKSDNFSRSARDASRHFTPNVKPKEGQMQGLNSKQRDNGFQGYQLKAKEAKPASFSFLKSLDATSSTAGMPEDPSSNSEKERTLSYAEEAINTSSRINYSGNTVCIRNLPSQSNLALVKEALSLHGEVISSFKTSNSDGSCNALVEFKTAEAMDGALASRWLNLDSKAFSIVRTDAPITTVVRVSRVTTDTTDSQLSSICEKFGSLDHVKRRGNGIYDVYYKANELLHMSKILDSLNEVTLNKGRWVAAPAPLLPSALRKEVLRRSDGQVWHASQLKETLNKIEMGLASMSLWFEDLKSLTSMEDEMTRLL